MSETNNPRLKPFEKAVGKIPVKIVNPKDILETLGQLDAIEVPSWFPDNIQVHQKELDNSVYPMKETCLECNREIHHEMYKPPEVIHIGAPWVIHRRKPKG